MTDPIEIVNGPYRARIQSGMVEIYVATQLVDNPGPWSTNQAAVDWAQLIIDDLARGIDHYGLN